jgi:hypothetical protein
MKNDGISKQIKILNLHAGINNKVIIDFITKEVFPDSISLMMHENLRREEYKKIALFLKKRKCPFFSMKNACKSMCLISELMCKHTYQKNPIPQNIVFITARKTYRLREKKDTSEGNTSLNNNLAHKEFNY